MVREKRLDFSKISNHRKGSILGRLSQRFQSLKKYYQNPEICDECEQVIEIGEDQIPSDIRGNKCCSLECSARNQHKEKGNNITECPRCGGSKSRPAEFCQECRWEVDFEKIMGRELKEVQHDGNSRIKNSYVRQLANRSMEIRGIEKKCKVCGIEKEVLIDVIHLKPISDFEPDAILRKVNGIENIRYACKNHHTLYDYEELDAELVEKLESSY